MIIFGRTVGIGVLDFKGVGDSTVQTFSKIAVIIALKMSARKNIMLIDESLFLAKRCSFKRNLKENFAQYF